MLNGFAPPQKFQIFTLLKLHHETVHFITARSNPSFRFL